MTLPESGTLFRCDSAEALRILGPEFVGPNQFLSPRTSNCHPARTSLRPLNKCLRRCVAASPGTAATSRPPRRLSAAIRLEPSSRRRNVRPNRNTDSQISSPRMAKMADDRHRHAKGDPQQHAGWRLPQKRQSNSSGAAARGPRKGRTTEVSWRQRKLPAKTA